MEHIKNIIDEHVKTYNGVREQIPTKALEILYKQGLYDECIYEVLRQYNMTVKLRIKQTKLHGAAATILRPEPCPILGSDTFKSYKFLVSYDKECAKESMELFVFSIAHEVGHILLYSTKNKNRLSEPATDLIAMVMGFDYIQWECFRKVKLKGAIKLGYLSDEEIKFACRYIGEKRNQAKNKPNVPKAQVKPSALKNFLTKLLKSCGV